MSRPGKHRGRARMPTDRACSGRDICPSVVRPNTPPFSAPSLRPPEVSSRGALRVFRFFLYGIFRASSPWPLL